MPEDQKMSGREQIVRDTHARCGNKHCSVCLLLTTLDAERTAHQQTRDELAEARTQLELAHCNSDGHYCDGMTEAWNDAQKASAELAEARAEVDALKARMRGANLCSMPAAALFGCDKHDEPGTDIEEWLLTGVASPEMEQAECPLCERDEARRGAVEAVRLAGLAPRDLGTELANRIATYRKALDDESPSGEAGA